MTTRPCQTLVVAACLLCGGVAHAQVARSQFNGTVTDSAGGVLVGATVVATNVETNVESKATTTDAGIYVIPYLANGLYQIRVTAAGFRPAEANQVTLRAAQTLTLDFKLEVDAITEALTVTAPVIETSTAEIGHYVSNKEFQTWPIPVADGQRQIQQFIFSSLPGTTGGTFEGSINGGRNYSHEILIEGMPLGRNLQGGSNNEMSPPTEAVGEFKLQTGTLGAEFGGGQTAVANFVVKSGTNQFHGSGAVYLHGSTLDARPFVAKALNQTTPVRELQNWAVALGGPIIAAEAVQRQGPQLLLRDVREDARGRTDLDRVPHAADARVPERRLLAPLRCRPTRATPARARSWGPTRSAGRYGSARSTTRARRASSTAA